MRNFKTLKAKQNRSVGLIEAGGDFCVIQFDLHATRKMTTQ